MIRKNVSYQYVEMNFVVKTPKEITKMKLFKCSL